MVTIESLHERFKLSPTPASIKKRLYRNNIGSFKTDEDLPPEAIQALANWYNLDLKTDRPGQAVEDKDPESPINGQASDELKALKAERSDLLRRIKDLETFMDRRNKDLEGMSKRNNGLTKRIGKLLDDIKALKEELTETRGKWTGRVFNWREISWRDVLATLPLPMLGLAASFGVFYFASNFVPVWFAIIEAAAFELTYIGLSAVKGLDEKQRKKALGVAIGAVLVSVIYNTISAALHQQPDLLQDLSPIWFWTVSLIYGAPIAILGFLVADLLLHRK